MRAILFDQTIAYAGWNNRRQDTDVREANMADEKKMFIAMISMITLEKMPFFDTEKNRE
jgi:hypothetical protein